MVPLRLPPLRERVDDIPALVQHFLVKAQADGLPLKTLTPEAMVRLKAHAWPGNVRELENLVRRLAVLYAEDTIGEDVIALELEQARAADARRRRGAAPTTASAARSSAIIDRYFRAHDGGLPPPGVYDRLIREVERPLIARALVATRGNQLKAADVLGLNRNTLRKKIRELDIQVSRGAMMRAVDGAMPGRRSLQAHLCSSRAGRSAPASWARAAPSSTSSAGWRSC